MAAKTTVIDIGNSVACDSCNEDYDTTSNKCGGFKFVSNAICPKCALGYMEIVKKYGEEKHIRSICKPDQTFREFLCKRVAKRQRYRIAK
jgi:hypothetical protein